MRKTVLNEWHTKNGASMTDFNGWHMPLYYQGITQEHQHTRTAAGLFDLGHMGRIIVRGPNAYRFIDHLTPAYVDNGKPGDVQYTFLLKEDGTVLDDITVYYDTDEVLLVVNAGNRLRDLAWIQDQAKTFGDGVEVIDKGDDWGMIALQGPRAAAILADVLGDAITGLDYYKFTRLDSADFPGDMIVSRTGYTGEDGFEVYFASENVVKLWEKLLESEDVKPIGLGARDSLRLEAAMPLYGHELSESLTPLHAGLGKFINLEKSNFIGRATLSSLKADGGPAQKLVGFEMDQRGPVARQGFKVLDGEGNAIGEVTSGIFSPTLQKTIGLAYINKEHSAVGNSISIDIRGRSLPAHIVKRPFYRRKSA